MRVLVTGDRGLVGRAVTAALLAGGHHVVGFDIKTGQDVRDVSAVQSAVKGCDAVVHLAVVSVRRESHPQTLHQTNVNGIRNILAAAVEAGINCVVYMSSVNALGVFRGESLPDFLPLTDAHPPRPTRPYGITKLQGEVLCSEFSEVHGLTTISLRPPTVWTESDYARAEASRTKQPQAEWLPFWEYGAFIDMRDLASATLSALECDFSGNTSLLVCSTDISTSTNLSSFELAQRLAPNVPWRGSEAYLDDPTLALVDCSPALSLLNWRPQYTWQRFLREQMSGSYPLAPGESSRRWLIERWQAVSRRVQ